MAKIDEGIHSDPLARQQSQARQRRPGVVADRMTKPGGTAARSDRSPASRRLGRGNPRRAPFASSVLKYPSKVPPCFCRRLGRRFLPHTSRLSWSVEPRAAVLTSLPSLFPLEPRDGRDDLFAKQVLRTAIGLFASTLPCAGQCPPAQTTSRSSSAESPCLSPLPRCAFTPRTSTAASPL